MAKGLRNAFLFHLQWFYVISHLNKLQRREREKNARDSLGLADFALRDCDPFYKTTNHPSASVLKL